MWWDLIQESQLARLENQIESQQKEIDQLKETVERLSQWVIFLTKEQDNVPRI